MGMMAPRGNTPPREKVGQLLESLDMEKAAMLAEEKKPPSRVMPSSGLGSVARRKKLAPKPFGQTEYPQEVGRKVMRVPFRLREVGRLWVHELL